MSDTQKRDRSPQFPYIGLSKALERIEVLFAKVKRNEAWVADLASDWGLTATSSSTDRTVAALLSYGLVTDCGGSKLTRKIKISEAGWRILEDHRPGVREAALAEAAMRPPIMQEYAGKWRPSRPDDKHAISMLKFEGGFTDDGAKSFIRVWDDTMNFASGVKRDISPDNGEEIEENGESDTSDEPPPPPPPPPPAFQKANLVTGERELTTGLLSKAASFRLIVSGPVGVEEIDRLIAKLQIDKEILADEILIMPIMGGTKALPVKATRISEGRYRLIGNIDATADRERWDFRGPVVACKQGDADGMSGLVVVANAPIQ